MCGQTFTDELEMQPFFRQRLWLLVYEKEDVGRLMLYQMSGSVYLTLYTDSLVGFESESVAC